MDDELTLDDLIDALEDLDDEELDKLRVAIDEEIAERDEPIELDEDEEGDEEANEPEPPTASTVL